MYLQCVYSNVVCCIHIWSFAYADSEEKNSA